MTLKEYLTKYRIPVPEFAHRSRINPSSVWHYFAGRRKPNQRTAERIERASDGLVSVKELRGKDDRIC
jgi:DNA-binding transcriptional regulator YdaS (Cro superfamily)